MKSPVMRRTYAQWHNIKMGSIAYLKKTETHDVKTNISLNPKSDQHQIYPCNVNAL